jgi:hypothetical protein
MGTVRGAQKLIQDLRVALLSPRGDDPLHPDFGSLLNGGIDELGNTNPGVIGAVINADTLLGIESEIRRVLNEYSIQQQSRLYEEMNNYGGQTTFSPDELLASIDSIDTTQVNDVVVVSVNIRTTDGTLIQIVRPVSDSA